MRIYEWGIDGEAVQSGDREAFVSSFYRTEPRRTELGRKVLEALDSATPGEWRVAKDYAGQVRWRLIGDMDEARAREIGATVTDRTPGTTAPPSSGRPYARPGAVEAMDAAVASHGGMVTGTWRDGD